MSNNQKYISKQMLYREMILGTLLYSVVLGFFNDYTDILYTKSYSTTFAVAIVMQVLTVATFYIKDKVVLRFRQKEDSSKVGLALSVWLIIFLSKFVFLWVLDFLFNEYIAISGFVGLLLIILVLTIAQKVVEYVDAKLVESDKKAGI